VEGVWVIRVQLRNDLHGRLVLSLWAAAASDAEVRWQHHSCNPPSPGPLPPQSSNLAVPGYDMFVLCADGEAHVLSKHQQRCGPMTRSSCGVREFHTGSGVVHMAFSVAVHLEAT
jgi:hypothetical protein